MPAIAEPEKLERPAGLEHRDMSADIVRVRAEGEATDAPVRFEFSISSDRECDIGWGFFEILDHTPEAVRLDFLNSGRAPLLWMHDRNEHRGVIESAKIEGGKIRVVARMSNTEKAKELSREIEDKIISNVSVGYRVHNEQLVKREVDADGYTIKAVWMATDWEPKEASFVTVPADDSVGMGRGEAPEKSRVRFLQQRATAEDPPAKRTTMPQATDPPTISVEEANKRRADDVTAERARIAGIHAAAEAARKGNMGDFSERAQEAIGKGESLAEFQSHVLANMKRTAPPTTKELGLTDKEAKRYSLLNVVEGMVNDDPKRYEFEAEVSRAAQAHMGHGNGARIAIPADVLLRGWIPKDPAVALRMGWGDRERTLISVSASSANSSNLVPRELMADMFIHSLRESQVLLARAQYLNGLVGDVDIPIELTNPIFYWVGEDVEPTEGAWTASQIQFRFKTVAARIPFTRRSEKQTTPGIESVIAANLRQGYALAVEKKAFVGAVSSTQPGGIYSTSGIGDVTSGGTLTFANALELRTDVAAANAPLENCEFFTSSKGVGLMRGTGIVANDAKRIAEWGPDGKLRCEGRVVHETNLSPDNLGGGTNKTGILFGDPTSIYIGTWGALEVMVDTATKAATGGKVLRVFGDVDIQIPQPARWSAIQDLS